MSKKITDVIDISGVLIAIGLIAIVGSVVRLIFTSNVFSYYLIGFGIVLLILGFLVKIFGK